MIADLIIAALAVFFIGLMLYKTVKKKKGGCGSCRHCSDCSGCQASAQKKKGAQ